MLGQKEQSDQLDFFRPRLKAMLQPDHELVQLAEELDWAWIEAELAPLYSEEGRPSVPIRTMVGMLLLKRMFNQSDESVVDRWLENPYWQYFTGEQYFQHRKPFDPTDFPKFRKRVGKAGMEKVLSLTVKLHPGAESNPEVQVDPTVQEKNITFPTDPKLHKKIIDKCREIAEVKGVKLRQSYRRTVPRLMRQQSNGSHPKRAKKAKAARRKLRTIAGRLVRELERELPEALLEAHYRSMLDLFQRVLDQKRQDKNKIYSLHEPDVCCIAKGKAHKKYEFGSKVAVVRDADLGVITGMANFNTNLYDGKTLDDALDQSQRVREAVGGNRPQEATVDRGCKGRKEVGGTTIHIPGKPKKGMSAYEKSKIRKRFRRRAAIEPTIGHLKADHRLGRNFLKGIPGDEVNALLAACGFNLKMRYNQIKEELKRRAASIFSLLQRAWETTISFFLQPRMA